MTGLEVDRPGITHQCTRLIQRHIRLADGATAGHRYGGCKQSNIRIERHEPLGGTTQR